MLKYPSSLEYPTVHDFVRGVLLSDKPPPGVNADSTILSYWSESRRRHLSSVYSPLCVWIAPQDRTPDRCLV